MIYIKYATGSEKVKASFALCAFLTQFPSSHFPYVGQTVGRPHEVWPGSSRKCLLRYHWDQVD